MRKLIVLGVLAGLVVGSIGVAEAAKKPTTLKLFLRDDNGCDGPPSTGYLSRADGEDQGCWYVDAGPAYDAIVATGLLTEDALSISYMARDGLPFTLDASKPLTAEISTTSGSCVEEGVCSPAQLGAGQATLKVRVIGFVDGSEQVLGNFSESFLVTPGSSHTSVFEGKLDASLNKKKVGSLRVVTYLAGAAVGHGIIELDNPASFVSFGAFK